MVGQHWGERDGKPSPLENAIVAVVSTGLALGYLVLLLLLAVSFLQAEACMVTRVSDGNSFENTSRFGNVQTLSRYSES